MILLWDKIILRLHFVSVLHCSDLVFLNSNPFLNCFPFYALCCVLFVMLSLDSATDSFLLLCFTQFKDLEIVCMRLLFLVCRNNLILDSIITEEYNCFDEKLSK